MLRKIDSSQFDWLKWRRGSPLDLYGVRLSCGGIFRIKDTIREHAIGFCRGDELPCRPKLGTIAIMLFKDGEECWFHLSQYEFASIFLGD